MALVTHSDEVSVLKFNEGIDGARQLKLTQLRLLELFFI
jgi:hypothetical protein